MISQPTNRLAEFLDTLPFPSVKPPRTEAQREASRRNGACSRGPISRAGKARSSGNALKHGLLARHVAPPGDRRRLDELYDLIHAELVEEFKPTTFTQASLIDSIAADYIDLIRVRSLIEALLRPSTLGSDEQEAMAAIDRCRHELDQLERVESDLKELMQPSPARIAAVAKLLADELAGVEAAVAPSHDDDPDGLDPLHADELKPLNALLVALGRDRKHWADPKRIAAVLRKKSDPTAMKRLRVLLDHAIGQRRQRLVWRNDQAAAVERRDATLTLQLAQDPSRLMTLREYQSRIEHAIDRKLRRLASRIPTGMDCAHGSR